MAQGGNISSSRYVAVDKSYEPSENKIWKLKITIAPRQGFSVIPPEASLFIWYVQPSYFGKQLPQKEMEKIQIPRSIERIKGYFKKISLSYEQRYLEH